MMVILALYQHEQVAVFDCMRGGKSHIVRLLGTLLGGIHLIFHPILSLAADQLTAFQSGCDDFGSIIATNLDEIATTSVNDMVSICCRLLEFANIQSK